MQGCVRCVVPGLAEDAFCGGSVGLNPWRGELGIIEKGDVDSKS